MKTNKRFLSVFATAAMLQAFAFGGTQPSVKISFDSVPMSQLYVAITFADGPSSMLTPQVLKILAAHDVKATFFVTGESAASHPDILKQEFAAGHEIGSRSWTHSMFGADNDTQLLTDLQRTDQAIKTATGSSPKLFSPFDANFTPVQCDTVYKQLGYTVIYWSVDSLAMKDKGAAAITDAIVTQAKPGSIIMSSDINSSCVQALPGVLDALTAKGYKFVTVPELIAMSGSRASRKTSTPRIVSSTPPQPVSTYTAPPAGTPSSTSPASVPAPAPAATGAFHPFGVQSPDGGAAVPDSNPRQ